jgi:glucose-6-phosphate 1-dehydrogenase
VLDVWENEKNAGKLPIYPAGSSGPVEADSLLARGGRAWRPVDAAGAGTSS